MTLPPLYFEHGFRLNRLTARTGGIRSIAARRLQGGRQEIEISGVLLPPMNRAQAPNFNRELPRPSEIGLPTYEIAHLWGPGFGDEAWDGMMYAPRAVNQEWQNRGIEQRLRDLRTLAGRAGATIELIAKGSGHPLQTWRGHQLLHEASYRFSVRFPDGSTRPVGRVELVVGPPSAPRVEVEVALHGLV